MLNFRGSPICIFTAWSKSPWPLINVVTSCTTNPNSEQPSARAPLRSPHHSAQNHDDQTDLIVVIRDINRAKGARDLGAKLFVRDGLAQDNHPNQTVVVGRSVGALNESAAQSSLDAVDSATI